LRFEDIWRRVIPREATEQRREQLANLRSKTLTAPQSR
jgi:hypothetical protein